MGIEKDPLVGKRIKLTNMDGDPNPVPLGTLGTVTYVTKMPGDTAVGVQWDNGRTLGLICPPDSYLVVED